ncbi:MAG TPA: hypothetical protein VF928_03010 [Usitatibacteraceae bacterium]
MKLLTLGAALSFTAAAANATIAVSNLHSEHLSHGAEAGAIGNGGSTLFTLAVVALFAISGLYALAASGRIRSLPLMQNAIYAITGFYLLRGSFLLPQLFGYNIFSSRYEVSAADLLLSALVLAIGIVHLVGLNRQSGGETR